MNDKDVLAPPGAGLPALEHRLARICLGVLQRTFSRQRSERWLRRETNRVLAIARTLSQEELQRQVLIPKPMGLEDSSRNWSAAMVLQHLVIVDNGIGEVIAALARKQAFGREVRIADVKPTADAGREQLDLLAEALRTYVDRVAAIQDLHTAERHGHPWFGPMDGHGWHTLAALHTMIHRRQLESIAHACAAPGP